MQVTTWSSIYSYINSGGEDLPGQSNHDTLNLAWAVFLWFVCLLWLKFKYISVLKKEQDNLHNNIKDLSLEESCPLACMVMVNWGTRDIVINRDS